MKILPLLLVLAAISLMCITTGCVSTREQMTRAGYDPSYVDGWVDGESSGYCAARNPYYRFKKDTYRFESDSQYKQGWSDGYDVTKTRYQSLDNALR